MHTCEVAVTTWTRQIKASLKADPEGEASVRGQIVLHGPMHELGFWRARAANLRVIHSRSSIRRVRKVVRVLEAIQFDLLLSANAPRVRRLRCRR